MPAGQKRTSWWILAGCILLVVVVFWWMIPPKTPFSAPAETSSPVSSPASPALSNENSLAKRPIKPPTATSRRTNAAVPVVNPAAPEEQPPISSFPSDKANPELPPRLVKVTEVVVPLPIPPGFSNYVEHLSGNSLSFEMIAISGGEITIGSPENEPGRDQNDLPLEKIRIKPFWMGKYEVPWELFLPFVVAEKAETDSDSTQGITHPTKPYGSVYRDRGEKGYPAMGMSQLSADNFAKWISKKTGKKYRLPTEAEWEYACRAGATTAYFWGTDPAQADKHGWYFNNSSGTTQPIGKKQPNKFGLYDIVGNVAEWCAKVSPDAPAIVRGGAWSEPVTRLRCAARMVECPEWNELDPQNPPSMWWLSAADFVGIRLARSIADEDATGPVIDAKPIPAGTGGVGTSGNYERYCAGCHGVDGRGQTTLGQRYNARDYTDPLVKASLESGAMIKAIKEGLTVNGKQVMSAYAEKLSEAEIQELARLIKSF